MIKKRWCFGCQDDLPLECFIGRMRRSGADKDESRRCVDCQAAEGTANAAAMLTATRRQSSAAEPISEPAMPLLNHHQSAKSAKVEVKATAAAATERTSARTQPVRGAKVTTIVTEAAAVAYNKRKLDQLELYQGEAWHCETKTLTVNITQKQLTLLQPLLALAKLPRDKRGYVLQATRKRIKSTKGDEMSGYDGYPRSQSEDPVELTFISGARLSGWSRGRSGAMCCRQNSLVNLTRVNLQPA